MDRNSSEEEDSPVGRRLLLLLFFLVLLLVSLISFSVTKNQDFSPSPPPRPLFDELITTEKMVRHLKNLNNIANLRDGNRSLGTQGYEDSMKYVLRNLRTTNYTITTQPFNVTRTAYETSFEQIRPNNITYEYGEAYAPMSYTGNGNVSGYLSVADEFGCSLDNFEDFVSGNIALIKRGSCTFYEKAYLASLAGASAVIIYNDGSTPDRFVLHFGTLNQPFHLPVISINHHLGLYFLKEEVYLNLLVNVSHSEVETWNIHAQSRYGNPERKIIVGSHLDSVSAGPGINDNGSGSSAVLEMAVQLFESGYEEELKNQIQFSWYGAEEAGLLGSNFFVSDLIENDPEEFSKIWLMLNFDMIGSPNPTRGIYDGDSGDEDVRLLSSSIQRLFEEYFNSHGLEWTPSPFTGRSDYGPFLQNGIPAGGLFTGAEVIKTEEERIRFGGLVASKDPCYHRECDTVENINLEVYQQMARAAANVSLTFGLHQFSREEQSLRREVMAKQKLRQFDGSATNLNLS